MFKMASFGFNTFTEAFSKITDDGRTLFYRNFIPGARQRRFVQFIPDLCNSMKVIRSF